MTPSVSWIKARARREEAAGVWLWARGECQPPVTPHYLTLSNQLPQNVPLFVGLSDVRLVFPHVDSCAALVLLMPGPKLYGYHLSDESWMGNTAMATATNAIAEIQAAATSPALGGTGWAVPEFVLVYGDSSYWNGTQNVGVGGVPARGTHFQKKLAYHHGGNLVVTLRHGVPGFVVLEIPSEHCDALGANVHGWTRHQLGSPKVYG